MRSGCGALFPPPPYSDICTGCLGSIGVSLLSEEEGKARDAEEGRPPNPVAQGDPGVMLLPALPTPPLTWGPTREKLEVLLPVPM